MRVRRSGNATEALGRRIADAISAACHPRTAISTSVGGMVDIGILRMSEVVPLDGILASVVLSKVDADVDALVVRLFEEEGRSLVRLVRLFVDDRNAAEDLVQEGFIRLARNAHKIKDETKAAAYLRSIVLNLTRDHNRRGLVSLRHHLPLDDRRASTEDEIILRDDQQAVIDVLRELPHRQRDCIVLRYYEELGIDDIAAAFGISRNSVKTHLRRGLAAMESALGFEQTEVEL